MEAQVLFTRCNGTCSSRISPRRDPRLDDALIPPFDGFKVQLCMLRPLQRRNATDSFCRVAACHLKVLRSTELKNCWIYSLLQRWNGHLWLYLIKCLQNVCKPQRGTWNEIIYYLCNTTKAGESYNNVVWTVKLKICWGGVCCIKTAVCLNMTIVPQLFLSLFSRQL